MTPDAAMPTLLDPESWLNAAIGRARSARARARQSRRRAVRHKPDLGPGSAHRGVVGPARRTGSFALAATCWWIRSAAWSQRSTGSCLVPRRQEPSRPGSAVVTSLGCSPDCVAFYSGDHAVASQAYRQERSAIRAGQGSFPHPLGAFSQRLNCFADSALGDFTLVNMAAGAGFSAAISLRDVSCGALRDTRAAIADADSAGDRGGA